MHSVTLIALLSFISLAHAKQVAASHTNDSENSMDELTDELAEKLTNKLVDRVMASFLRNYNLDATTLEKAGNLGTDLPVQTSYGQDPMDDRTVLHHDFLDDKQQESMLNRVLSLRGGKKPAHDPTFVAKLAMKDKKPSGKPRKLNAYFAKLSEARKSSAKSFEYNGKTYVRTIAKGTGLISYKAK